MYYPARLIALICIATLTFCAQLSPAADKKLKVHILGDSITQSIKNNYCWRYWLWLKLKDNDLDGQVDFVGSSSGPGKGWDNQHDGHWGQNTWEILSGLKKWAPRFKADIALIHLGSNDMRAFEVTQSIENFKDIIGLLRTNNASVGIVIGQIPSWSTARDEKVGELNKELLTLKALDTEASPIRIIDLSQGYERKEDNYDSIHPNESGAKKYTEHFYPALMDMINFHQGVTAISLMPRVPDNPVPVTGSWRRINGQLFIRIPAIPTQRVFLNIQGKRGHRDEYTPR